MVFNSLHIVSSKIDIYNGQVCILSLEEGMATHSSTLGWRIPWTEEPGGLQSMGSHRVGHNWACMYVCMYVYVCICMLSNWGAGEGSWESLGQQEDQTSQSYRKLALNINWTDWRWSFNTFTIWSKELTHWKRPWFWERLRAGKEVGSRGWGAWMAPSASRTWVWASYGTWWRTGKPCML